jgi:hypothetical protein
MASRAARHLPWDARRTYRDTVAYLEARGAWSPCYRPLVEAYAHLGWLSAKLAEGIATVVAGGQPVPAGLNREYTRTTRALESLARTLTIRPRASRAGWLRQPLAFVPREVVK